MDNNVLYIDCLCEIDSRELIDNTYMALHSGGVL